MMNDIVVQMFKSLIISILLGIILSFFIAFFKTVFLEMGFVKNKIGIFFLDLTYIILFTLILILLIYYACDGRFRGMYIFTLLFGSLIYNRILAKSCGFVFRVLLFPIKVVIKFIYKWCKNIINFFFQGIAKFLSRLYNKYIKNRKLETISERK